MAAGFLGVGFPLNLASLLYPPATAGFRGFFGFWTGGGGVPSGGGTITSYSGISVANGITTYGSISYLTIDPPSTTILAPISHLTGVTETTYLIDGEPLQ